MRELSHSNNTTSASAQMLFSPDSAARLGRDQSPAYRTAVQQSTLTGCNTLTAGEIAAQQPRPISAPRLRPQSLSSQLQAHSDRLNASSSPPTAAVPIPVPVDGVMRPAGTVAPVPVRNVGFPTDALSPTPSARPVNVVTPPAVASPPSTHQQGTPGSGGGGSGGKTKPASHGHAHTHAPVSKPAVRSADVLSANKAAKLAALHAHTTSTNNGNSHATAGPAGSNGGGGAARYAQPTHSSAAATAALLVHQPTTTAGVAKAPRSRIPTSRAPTASHPSSSAGIAAASAADEGGGPTSTTPQRKMIRKLSTATATGIPMTRRREGAPTSHGAEKAPLAAEGKVFKSAKPSSSGVERKEVAAAVAKATKTSPVGGKRSVSGTGGTTKTRIPSSSKGHAGESATTAGNASAASQSGTASGVAAISSSSSALCDSTLNADAIMQILQGGGASPDRVMRDNQNQESNFDQQQHHTAPTAARQAHQQAQLESAAHTSMLEKLRRVS